MAALGFELVFRFIWGWTLCLFLVDRRETSERFLKVSFWVVAGIALFDGLMAESATRAAKLFSIAVLVVGHALYAFFPGRVFRIAGFIAIVAAPAAILRARGLGEMFNFLTASFLIGAIFMGQFLGHWYLNVPGMNIRELRKVVWAAIVAIGLKIAENLYTLFIQVGISPRLFATDDMGRPLGIDLSTNHGLESINPTESLFGMTGDGPFGLGFYGQLILLTRVLWGLLAPVLLIWMIKKTVDIRSTQSATGIFYALCVMILIGEGAALYLMKSLGWLI